MTTEAQGAAPVRFHQEMRKPGLAVRIVTTDAFHPTVRQTDRAARFDTRLEHELLIMLGVRHAHGMTSRGHPWPLCPYRVRPPNLTHDHAAVPDGYLACDDTIVTAQTN